ncbi:MAG: hypothetical protein E6600_06810 [Anaerocolumna aminovalerica]|uniref:hypothetical protein n=1 Tax=Anaerocolumna aminovalerica TaxID=1527 RepID=UPI000BE34249|nr:hypothetical protein [Anaerocolumna aminovalerica]MDU6264199.1 hypothetical protein [Anaerocolumna aminovalerica]
MAEYTKNYKLEKQQGNDNISIEGLNENFDKIDTALGNSSKFEKASGTGTAIILNNIVLEDGVSKSFIVSANNNGAATTINGKKLHKPGTAETPNLIAGKAVTVWYNTSKDCFFIKASATGNAVAANVLAGKTFSNDDDSDIVGTIPNRTFSANGGGYITGVSARADGGGALCVEPQTGYYESGVNNLGFGSIFVADENFKPANMLAGKTYFKMAGGIPTNTDDGYGHINATGVTAGAWSGNGKNYAYLGIKPHSYIRDVTSWVQSEQPDLLSQNIVSGKTILGVPGTAKQIDGGINGVIRNYYVYAGKSISAGDFVNFITGVSGVGAGTATEKQLMVCSSFYSACALDDKRVLIAYKQNSNDSKPSLVLVSIDGVEYTVSPVSVADPVTVTGLHSVVLIRLSSTKALLVYTQAYIVYAIAINISGNAITSMGTQQQIYKSTDYNEAFYIMSGLNGGGSVKCSGSVDSTHACTFIFVSKTSNPYMQLLNMTVSGNTVTGTLTYVGGFSSGGSSAVKFGATVNEAGTRAYAFIKDGNQAPVYFYGYTISGGTCTRTMSASQGGAITSGINSFTILCCGNDNLMMFNEAKVDGTNPYSYVWGIKVNHSSGTISVKNPILVASAYAPRLEGYTELASNKIMMIYTNSTPQKARVITFDADANLTLGAETSRTTYMNNACFLPGTSKSILIGMFNGSGGYYGAIIYNCPATSVEFLNYLYETQVTPSTDNNVNGVALTSGVGGTLSGAGASHRDAIRVVSRV